MKIIGDAILAKDENGKLKSRIGTLFLKTPGLVTENAIHAVQRTIWLDYVNEKRAESGLPAMTIEEEDDELRMSADLIFTDEFVLIRPDPAHMDVAFQADEVLQKLVSKRRIRFLNTHSAKVRNALRARGENWRMARAPVSQEDMAAFIQNSRVPISEGGESVYYYNKSTGTRYVTAGTAHGIADLPADRLRVQVKEAQTLVSRRNRIGHPELDLFPVTTPIDIKTRFKAIDVDALGDDELRDVLRKIDTEWRMSIPAELREETVENFAWRNAMAETLTATPNETTADERDLIQGISPEFYRQIEWLPGARIDGGEIIFDPLWDEYNRTRDPELGCICDQRVRNIIFNFSRIFGDIEYINVGRIVHSLARDPIAPSRRGFVYIIQLKTNYHDDANILMARFLKWGVAERLDEGKDLLQSMVETNEYIDYVLDRRLMCKQLGMNLPVRLGNGQITEIYHGHNQYNGTTIQTYYNVRNYVRGIASDKIQPSRFRNPAFAQRFARPMGEAAAVDMIVGRRPSETKENLFDRNYEVVQIGEDGLPAQIVVTDHAGSFFNYLHEFEDFVAPYANVVRRRCRFVADYASFANEFAEGFESRLRRVQSDYRARRRAFDELFVHRPFDVGGSGAFRWAKTLERLDRCDPEAVTRVLRAAIDLPDAGEAGAKPQP